MTDTSFKLGSLKKRSEFLYVRDGIYKARGGVVIQARANPHHNDLRVGFTATKRVGNAVIRNRAKRRLRAVARAVLPTHGMAGYDYVFIARDSTANRPYERLLDDGSKALLSLRETAQKSARSSGAP